MRMLNEAVAASVPDELARPLTAMARPTVRIRPRARHATATPTAHRNSERRRSPDSHSPAANRTRTTTGIAQARVSRILKMNLACWMLDASNSSIWMSMRSNDSESKRVTPRSSRMSRTCTATSCRSMTTMPSLMVTTPPSPVSTFTTWSWARRLAFSHNVWKRSLATKSSIWLDTKLWTPEEMGAASRLAWSGRSFSTSDWRSTASNRAVEIRSDTRACTAGLEASGATVLT